MFVYGLCYKRRDTNYLKARAPLRLYDDMNDSEIKTFVSQSQYTAQKSHSMKQNDKTCMCENIFDHYAEDTMQIGKAVD